MSLWLICRFEDFVRKKNEWHNWIKFTFGFRPRIRIEYQFVILYFLDFQFSSWLLFEDSLRCSRKLETWKGRVILHKNVFVKCLKKVSWCKWSCKMYSKHFLSLIFFIVNNSKNYFCLNFLKKKILKQFP